MTIENAGTDLLPVQGLVTVELACADTGRVLHRETQDNFLSLQSLVVARWWQRLMWGLYNPVETNDTLGTRPSEMPWFPAQHLAYWNDATAESAGTEDGIAKDLIGWASRHPVGSPSGKRGVVNITESEFKDASAKWVMDWTTSQGNGTFQSVGWTRVDETSGFLVPRYPEDDAVSFTNAGNSAGSSGRPLWFDGTLWNSCEWVSATTQYRLVSFPAAGGVSTSIVLLPAVAWRDDFSTVGQLFGLARISTDIITCGSTSTGPKLMRHTVAASQTWTRTETALGSSIVYRDCTIDGSSNIWTAGSDGVVRRHSNSDGTISATFTPTVAPTALTGIAYDASDGNLWLIGTVAGRTGQLWKIDTSGNTVGPLWSLSTSALAVTSSSPFTGSYNVPVAGRREPFQLTHYRVGTQTGVDLARSATTSAATAAWTATGQNPLVVKSGAVWVSAGISSLGGATGAAPVRGGTLGTRTKLGSAITKTNAQTLKVTYQFNFS